MYLYGFVYRVACAYQNMLGRVRHALCDPLRAIRRNLIPNDAVVDAVVYNSVGGKRVLYQHDTLTWMYNLFLMWAVFGTQVWVDVYRDDMHRFFVDGECDEEEIMYVKLANGQEFLTREPFRVTDIDEKFVAPERRYLCVMVGAGSQGNHNMTRYYKRFASSWNALKLRAIDMLALGIKLDPGVRSYLCTHPAGHPLSITTIDDDTFAERVFGTGDIVAF